MNSDVVMRLYRVVAPHFVAGILVSDDGVTERIVSAPPILKWAIGKRYHDIERWCSNKGYSIKLYKEHEDIREF